VDQSAGLQAFAATKTKSPRADDVAIISLTGLIVPDPFLVWLLDGTHPDDLARQFRAAGADSAVKAIVLLTNSPGGSVELIAETAAEIRHVAAVKPTVAIARTMMCSAAYWLAAQCGEILATPSAEIGSLGVYGMHVDVSRRNEQLGVAPTYIYAGKYKVEDNSDSPLGAEARASLQQRVDETHALFLKDVARGRGETVAKVRSGYGEGRSFGAAEAVKRGMADRIGTLDQALVRLSTTSGRAAAMARSGHERQARADRNFIDIARA
jgi:signal peptide peptidase SppA